MFLDKSQLFNHSHNLKNKEAAVSRYQLLASNNRELEDYINNTETLEDLFKVFNDNQQMINKYSILQVFSKLNAIIKSDQRCNGGVYDHLESYFPDLNSKALSFINEFNLQDIRDILNAFEKLGTKIPPEFFCKLGQKATETISSLKPHEILKISMTLSDPSVELTPLISSYFISLALLQNNGQTRFKGAQHQEISLTINALCFKSSDFQKKLFNELFPHTQLVDTYKNYRIDNDSYIQVRDKVFTNILHDRYDPINLVDISTLLKKNEIQDGGLLIQIGDSTSRQIKKFTPKQIIQIAQAFHELTIVDSDFFNKTVKKAFEEINDFINQDHETLKQIYEEFRLTYPV